MAQASCVIAAQRAGRRSGDTVATWVARFNRDGLAALGLRHGGGPHRCYGPAEQARMLAEIQRVPNRERDGTATWSLTTLQRALRQAPDGLPQVSTYTIWRTLREAGFSWQRTRSWCATGTVKRRRKAGVVEITDPDAGEARNTEALARLAQRFDVECLSVRRPRGEAGDGLTEDREVQTMGVMPE